MPAVMMARVIILTILDARIISHLLVTITHMPFMMMARAFIPGAQIHMRPITICMRVAMMAHAIHISMAVAMPMRAITIRMFNMMMEVAAIQAAPIRMR
jgi:hypothetical protein